MSEAPSTPRRIIIATTWARPALAAAYLLAIGPAMPPDVEFVFAVPHEPTERDAKAATVVMEGTTAVTAQLAATVESFSEVLSKPYHVALIPPAEQSGAWEAFTLAVVEARHIDTVETKKGGALHTALQDYTEREPVTASARLSLQPPEQAHDRWSTYLGGGITLVKMAWGGRVAVPTSHVRLLGNLVETGEFEPAFTSYLSRTVKPGDVIVDVGANIGIHTVLMGTAATGAGRVIAYEPFPENLSCLRKSVAASTLIGVVDIRARAASDSAARVPMAVSEMWRGQGSLMRDQVEIIPGLMDTDSYQIEVETVRLDVDLANERRIALIKVDVEGAEEKVFAGMTDLISRGAVDRIAFECYRTHIAADWVAFSGRLRSMESDGWTFRILDERGVDYEVPASTIIEHGFFETVVVEAPHLRPR